MRDKIIGVFGIVVLIISAMSFALMRASLGDLSNKGESQRAVTSAVAQLQVEGLRIERWLSGQTGRHMLKAFDAGTPRARSNEATTIANTIEEHAKRAAPFASVKPTLIVLFDAKGIVLGRNGSELMRGGKLGERHPLMMKTIMAGKTGSDVWVDKSHNEQLLTSYAPIRNETGKVIGGIALGTSFGNDRLQNTSVVTSQSSLAAAVPHDGKMILLAKSQRVAGDIDAAIIASLKALNTDRHQVVSLTDLPPTVDGSARTLGGYGDGKRAVIIALTPAVRVGTLTDLMMPLLGVIALGLILTLLGAYLIDAYISRPVSDLEDGLLAVINGQTDLRFELEHQVLGGLVFRINSLLNQLLGVREDTTDEEGRPSNAPSPEAFTGALTLDERMVSLSLDDVDDAHELRDEAPEDYYKRIFDEYIEAKRSLGDPVDHFRFAPFCERIKSSEQQLGNKHGKPFRYRIEVQGKEIVLLAVPLA